MKFILLNKAGEGLSNFHIMVYKLPVISCETEETREGL
jgi:hypothetical protein